MNVKVTFDTGGDPLRTACAAQWAAAIERQVRERASAPIASPPAERVDVELVVTFARHPDPADLGRWEGEGGAPGSAS